MLESCCPLSKVQGTVSWALPEVQLSAALLWVCMQSTDVDHHAKHWCRSACKTVLWVTCKALLWVCMFVKHRRGSACQTGASSAGDNPLFSSGQQEVQLSKWHQPKFILNTLHLHNNDTPMIRKVSQKKKCLCQCRAWAELTQCYNLQWADLEQHAGSSCHCWTNPFLVISKRYLWTFFFLFFSFSDNNYTVTNQWMKLQLGRETQPVLELCCIANAENELCCLGKWIGKPRCILSNLRESLHK